MSGKKIPTPGWMIKIIKDFSQEVWYKREFKDNGEIREGEYKKYGDLINGWKW